MNHAMNSYMPHGHCFLWQSDLLLLHIVSDALIAISYFTIPLAIYYFVKHKQVRSRLVPMMFFSFILTCGITHIFTIWNFWHTDYWLSGWFKTLCAAISSVTAVSLWVLMPRALKLPTVKDMEEMNEKLQEANTGLELKVQERTDQLERLNQELAHVNSIISHDFKNSLQLLIGYTELAQSSNDVEELHDFTQKFGYGCLQLERLIDDLSSLVRMGARASRCSPGGFA